jgi:hypothetical protein
VSHSRAVLLQSRNFCALFALALALLSAHAQSQLPVSVNPCDLVAHPEAYAGRTIKVRAKVSIGFENFTIATPGCNEKGREVWLMYGGDEPTPTMSTVNDQSRPAGSVLKVEGRPVVLRHDSELELFKRRLSAQRLIGVSDEESLGICRFYDVTATITGIFFAAPDRPLGGFGHMGCCHLLAIQQIEDVDAQRTGVPAGGRYSCRTDTWNVPAAEMKPFDRRECKGLEDCRSAVLEQIEKAALHWNDPLPEAAEGDLEPYIGPSWRSSDLLKTYGVRAQWSGTKQQSQNGAKMNLYRTLCSIVSPPLPISTPIGCKSLWSEFLPDRKEADQIENGVKQGQEEWRMGSPANAAGPALEEASRLWGITPVQGLTFKGCDNPMIVGGDQFSWCNWVDPDGMQQLTVQVTRFGLLRRMKQWDGVPWILSRGNGVVCAAENRTFTCRTHFRHLLHSTCTSTPEFNRSRFQSPQPHRPALHLKCKYDVSTFVAPPLQDAAAG